MYLAKLSLLLTCLLVPLALAHSETTPHGSRSVAVAATGTVYGEPDKASFDAGVTAVNADVQVATARVNERVKSLIQALLEAGVAKKDIRTSSFTIYPEQRYDNNGQPTTLRYRVSNIVHVTVRDTEQLGELLGSSIEAGANEVSNVVYAFSDRSALERQARKQAMMKAHEKAQQLARFGGAELGKVQRITEDVQPGGVVPLPQFRMESLAASDAGAEVPVSSGQLAVTVTVQVTFGLE